MFLKAGAFKIIGIFGNYWQLLETYTFYLQQNIYSVNPVCYQIPLNNMCVRLFRS